MGGIGSGRRHQGGRGTTSDYRSLDVRRLHRDGLLAPGQVFGWNWTRDGDTLGSIVIRTDVDKLILIYRHQRNGGDWTPMGYAVPLDWTDCTYGGARPWFRCPATGCGRRVAKLYLGGSGLFACRHCYRLAYDCQRETDDDRATRRAETIRQRLGWEAGILNLSGRRPKGMHHRTVERLKVQHDAFVSESIAGMARRLRLVEKGLGGLLDDLDVEW
ncbi:hypothetical protein [Thiocystis violacea]|uniref:hypothetical protein n=1 Tax=Thiocystis violacea TaxID=13725 RepID=UPI00190451D5|nr:hypothetical protein [Thiocystis violacea]MBK1720320.1 hypothetical protein [Thiocystis violacea]